MFPVAHVVENLDPSWWPVWEVGRALEDGASLEEAGL